MLASLAAVPGCADDITFTASTGAGVMYGVARELVYSSFNGESGLLSELDWDLRPLVYTKAELIMNTAGGFAASLDVRMGIPAKTGIVQDSDWKNFPYDGDTSKTHYSQNDCFTERAILLDAQVGWVFPLASWIALRPFLAFDFMDFKWTGRDGYLQYPPQGAAPYTPWSADEPRTPMSGVSIIYQQTWFIPVIGIESKLSLGENLTGSVSFAVSPVVFCNDVDNHVHAGSDFYDDTSGGFMLEPKVSLDWQVTVRAKLSLAVSFRHIEGLVGNTDVVANVNGIGTPGLVSATYHNGAGVSFDALDASLNITWVL
jgi:outer membrane protease